MYDVDLEELQRVTYQLLSATPKLRFDEAKSIALTMKDVSEATKEAFEAWGPSDTARGLHRMETELTSLYNQLRPYRRSIMMTGGFVACFYGKNFKYSILFARTFWTSGWRTLGPAIDELQASYQRGKIAAAKAAEESEDVSDELSFLAAFRGVILAVDPAKLLQVLKSAYVSISAAFAAVLSESAARLGLGVSLGDHIADAVNAIVAPFIHKLLTKYRDPVQDALKDQNLIDDATIRQWLDAIIAALSTALGVYVAHRVDDVIFLYSACVAGATLCVDNAGLLLGFRQRNFKWAIWGLAGAGFYYQRILGKGQIPILLRLPLTPISLGEATLRSIALSLRANKAF